MKLAPVSHILVAVASLAIIATCFLPVWPIRFRAPQHPEALNMKIWLSKLSGGWILIAAGTLAGGAAVYQLFVRHRRRSGTPAQPGPSSRGALATSVLAMAGLSILGCSAGPEPLRYGQDDCANCKMTLTDNRFGAEILTQKGKAYKFDDLNCLVQFLDKGPVPAAEVAHILSADFNKPGSLINVENAFFLENETVRSPMRADVATFSTEADRAGLKRQLGGGWEMTWSDVRENFKK